MDISSRLLNPRGVSMRRVQHAFSRCRRGLATPQARSKLRRMRTAQTPACAFAAFDDVREVCHCSPTIRGWCAGAHSCGQQGSSLRLAGAMATKLPQSFDL